MKLDDKTLEDNRRYALDLLNRAGVAFDARDISTVAAILPLVIADTYELGTSAPEDASK